MSSACIRVNKLSLIGASIEVHHALGLARYCCGTERSENPCPPGVGVSVQGSSAKTFRAPSTASEW